MPREISFASKELSVFCAKEAQLLRDALSFFYDEAPFRIALLASDDDGHQIIPSSKRVKTGAPVVLIALEHPPGFDDWVVSFGIYRNNNTHGECVYVTNISKRRVIKTSPGDEAARVIRSLLSCEYLISEKPKQVLH